MSLNHTLNQIDLTDIFREFFYKRAEYTYFSGVHGMFPRIDHILRHKTNPNKFKKTEVIRSIFSDQYAMKLEIDHKNTEKHKDMIDK